VIHGVAYLACAVSSSCCDEATQTPSDHCFVPRAYGKPAAETVKAPVDKSVRETKDLSSVHVDKDAATIRISVAVPGVRKEDLAISTQDHILRVSGESTKGSQTFKVDRSVALPSVVDIDSAAAACDMASSR